MTPAERLYLVGIVIDDQVVFGDFLDLFDLLNLFNVVHLVRDDVGIA